LQKYTDQKLIEDFKNLLIINSHQFLSHLLIHLSAGSLSKKNEGKICSTQGLARPGSYSFSSSSIQLGV
jgi:hypothetical protein